MIPIVNGVASAIEHTSNATPKLIKRIEVPAGTTVTIYGLVVTGQNNAAAEAIFVKTQQLLVYNNATGVLPELTASIAAVTTDPLALGYAVTLTPSGQYVDVYVTAAAGHEVDWNVWAERVEMATQVFTPADVPGLLVDLDSSKVTLAAGKVSSWPNQADVAFLPAVAEADPAQRPTWNATDVNFKGQPSLTYTGVERLTGDFTADLAQPGCAFGVLRFAIAGIEYIWDGGSDATKRWQFYSNGAVGTGVEAYAGNPITTGAYDLTTNLYAVSYNGASGFIEKNGAGAAAGNDGALANAGLTIGSPRPPTAVFKFIGTFARYLLYNNVPSAGNRAKLLLWSQTLYGTP